MADEILHWKGDGRRSKAVIAAALIGWQYLLMEDSGYEWVPQSPTIRQRIVAAGFVAAMLVTNASSYAGWRLFGDYDKLVATGVTIVGLIMFAFFMPTVRRR